MDFTSARKSASVQGHTTVPSNIKFRWNHVHERIEEEIVLFQLMQEVSMLEGGHGQCELVDDDDDDDDMSMET